VCATTWKGGPSTAVDSLFGMQKPHPKAVWREGWEKYPNQSRIRCLPTV